jgi:uncharacterized membrane protein YdjX (TVP38/TMEM64 family)
MKLARVSWTPYAATAALIVASALVALFTPAREWADGLEDALEHRNLAAALALFCVAAVVGTLLMVPAWVFPVAAGAVFGWGWGLAASVVASGAAALCAYLVARHVLHGAVERAAHRNESFKAVDQAVRKAPFKVVALVRLSPVLPSGLKSYFLGLTRVRPLAYTLASALGMLPGNALKAYVGAAGRDVLGGGGTLKWTLLGVGIVATIGLSLLIGRVSRRKLGL